MNGDEARLEIVVIEANQSAMRQVLPVLALSPRYNTRILAPDRALTAHAGWLGPDVLLVGMDQDADQRLAYARRIQLSYPRTIIIGFTSNYTADALAQAMAAGARRVLRSPFDLAALERAIREIQADPLNIMAPPGAAGVASTIAPVTAPGGQRPVTGPSLGHQVVALFSPKGGVGCSTLAVNLAIALQSLGQATALVDGNISFGSLEVFMELQPAHSLLELIADTDQLSLEAVMDALITHSSGVQVLLAPLRPEEGDGVRGEHLQHILSLLRTQFAFTLVDTWPSYDERVLAVLEMADRILVPIGPDLPAMKNLNSFLRVARLLNYDMEKIVPILMRSNSVPPGHLKELEAFLKQPLRWRIVSDGKRATEAANTGTPFVVSARDSQISQNVYEIARFLAGDGQQAPAEQKARQQQPPSGRFWRR